MRTFNKIFVIALPRCATVSMCDALGMLGVRTAHLGKIFGEATPGHNHPQRLIRMHEQITAGNFELDILRECDGLADYPACSFDVFKQLDQTYPDSLFINVARVQSIDRWLQSVERQFVGLQLLKSGNTATEAERQFMSVMLSFRTMTFGQSQFCAAAYREAYVGYQRQVAEYFAGREFDLLNIADVRQLEHEGYRLLADFLQCDAPTGAFPCSDEHSVAPRQAFMHALNSGTVDSLTGIKPA